MCLFCPLTKTFNVDEPHPLILPHEFLQPVEITILEFTHNTRYNHKLYNLIQNTPYEFSPSFDEHKINKALELFWPLLQSKYIIRLIAKLLTSSEVIHVVFPHGFFTNEKSIRNLKNYTNKVEQKLTILYNCFLFFSILHRHDHQKKKNETKNIIFFPGIINLF